MKSKILIVDDEKHMCETIEAILSQQEGYDVAVCHDAKSGLRMIQSDPIDAVITDVRMPGMDGIAFLSEMKKNHPFIPVIMITAYGNMKSAVDALKRGAFDYLAKPFDPDELLLSIKKALEYENLILENRSLRSELSSRFRLVDIVEGSKIMRDLKNMIAKAAPTNSTVLIEGESGVGKELVAHSLHYHSQRAGFPFVAVNCAAFTETLLESELFGYEKGAFTGAQSQKKGKFEVADHGTLYLDEIGDMSLNLQAKVLRVLQDQVFFRVGGTDPVRVNVRIVVATNKNLKDGIKKGVFREDLYYRFNVMNIKVPPLRERKDDIVPLTQHLVKEMKKKFPDRERFKISEKYLNHFKNYHWPGNVRELENLIERAFIMNDETVFLSLTENAQDEMPSVDETHNYTEAVDAFRKKLIVQALQRSNWRIGKAADALGVSRHALHYQMESLGIKEG